MNYELSYELGKIVENASYTKERLLEYRNEVRDILFNCTMLGDLQDVVLDYNDIPQEKDMAYCSNIEDSNIGLCLEIIKYNEIVRACHQYYSEIMEYVRMIREIKSYSFRHPIHSDYLVKFGSSKKNESLLICLLYKLEKGYELIETDKHSIIVKIFNSKTNDIDYMNLCLHTPLGPETHIKLGEIFIKTKRKGIGTFALEWVEKELIPELNLCIDDYNNRYARSNDFEYIKHIESIQGRSKQISDDTDDEARSDFYIKNGFILIGDSILKKINY